MRAAHGAEVGGFGSVLGEGFVVIEAGGDRIEAEVELVFPAEFEAGFAEGVVAVLGTGVAFGEVGECLGWREGDRVIIWIVSALAVGGNEEVGGRSC